MAASNETTSRTLLEARMALAGAEAPAAWQSSGARLLSESADDPSLHGMICSIQDGHCIAGTF